MLKLRTYLKRLLYLIPVLIAVVIIIGGLTYLIGGVGLDRSDSRLVETVVATIPAPLIGTPVARYPQVDPEVEAYLDQLGADEQPMIGEIAGIVIQPLGAYLPYSPSTSLVFGEATPLPTPLPYPTSPPLPLPPLSVLPTLPPVAEENPARVQPFVVDASTECGPEGNPVEGLLTQRFHAYHSGIDVALPLGSPVYATHSGQVIYADWSEVGYGYLVILQSGSFITYYAHNTSFNVTNGQFVGKGSVLAWSGSTGNSTGPHVHYETRINDVPVDPLSFASRGHGTC